MKISINSNHYFEYQLLEMPLNDYLSEHKVPIVGDIYIHYKENTRYRVVNIGIQEDTKEIVVCYVRVDSNNNSVCWVRKLDDWNTKVQKIPFGSYFKRFTHEEEFQK